MKAAAAVCVRIFLHYYAERAREKELCCVHVYKIYCIKYKIRWYSRSLSTFCEEALTLELTMLNAQYKCAVEPKIWQYTYYSGIVWENFAPNFENQYPKFSSSVFYMDDKIEYSKKSTKIVADNFRLLFKFCQNDCLIFFGVLFVHFEHFPRKIPLSTVNSNIVHRPLSTLIHI